MPIGQTNFPGTVDTPSTLIEATNNAATKLTAPLSIGNTLEMLVEDTSLFPATSVITVGSERIAYSGKTPTSLTGLIRAFGGTVDAFHAANADIKLLIIAEMHNAHTEAIIAVEEYVLAGGAGVIPGGVDTEIQVNAAGVLGAVAGFNIADGMLNIPADVTFPVKESLSGEWLEDGEFEVEQQWVFTDGWTWGGDGTVSYLEPTIGAIGAAVVIDGGAGYTPYGGNLVIGDAGDGNAEMIPLHVIGSISGFYMTVYGSGYVVGDEVTVESGDHNAIFSVVSVGGSGELYGVELVSGGTNYPMPAEYPVSGGSGSGAIVFVNNNDGSPLYNVIPAIEGSGYQLGDTSTPTGNVGAGAILQVSALHILGDRKLYQPGVLMAGRYYTVTVHVTGVGHLILKLDGGDSQTFDVAASGGMLTFNGIWQEQDGVRLLIQAQSDFAGTITSASVTGYLAVPRLLQVATSEISDGTGINLIAGRGINGLGGKGEVTGGLAWGDVGYSGDLLGGPGVVAGGKAGDTDGLVFGASVHSLGASYHMGVWSGGDLWLRGGTADTASRRDRFEGTVAPDVNGGNIRLTSGPAYGSGMPGVVIAESRLLVPDDPYDPSNWDNDLSVPTKHSLTAILETLKPAGEDQAVQIKYDNGFFGPSGLTFELGGNRLRVNGGSINVQHSGSGNVPILRGANWDDTQIFLVQAGPTGYESNILLGSTSVYASANRIDSIGSLSINNRVNDNKFLPLSITPALLISSGSYTAIDLTTAVLDINVPNIYLDAAIPDGPHATWFNTRIAPTTISHAAATATITDAASLRVDGPPIAGTGVTLTNSWSLWVAGGPSRFDGSVIVPDDPYDATGWNGNLSTPTKNAIRGKIESLSVGGAGFPSSNATVTAATYTAGAAQTILLDCTSNAITVSLPAASTSNNASFLLKKIDASANTVTIDADAGELIDGATTFILNYQWSAVLLVCDGAAWYIF